MSERVVWLHLEESRFLWFHRAAVLGNRSAGLEQIESHDGRLDAHLDGLRVAGESGWAMCEAALDEAAPGLYFTAVVRALEDSRAHIVERAFSLLSDGSVRQEVAAALAWSDPRYLRGTIAGLLDASEPGRRLLGIDACIEHGVDPGLRERRQLEDADPLVRAGALRAAGVLGRLEWAATCAAAVQDPAADVRFAAARSAVLLGDRSRSLNALLAFARDDDVRGLTAFRLGLQALPLNAAHDVLRSIAQNPARVRVLIEGAGLVGDPSYVPWLIDQMAQPDRARLAGEAFCLITGADGDALRALRVPPPGVGIPGPTDDPDDPDVSMDPDEGLPWPDIQKASDWWTENARRFEQGRRYFLGEPVTPEHCLQVLKHGYQPQRIIATHYLCLLNPGTPLFNVSAPAWRQRQLLAGTT